MGLNNKSIKTQSNETLKINKKLPQIKLSRNNTQFLFDWWNSDIRFEYSVPQAFTKGYFILTDNDMYVDCSSDRYRKFVSTAAKHYKRTFREIDNAFKEFVQASKDLTLYFEFLSENKLLLKTYDARGQIWNQSISEFGDNGVPEQVIDLKGNVPDIFNDDIEKTYEFFHYINLALFITCLWYIATTKKTTKYVYEQKHSVVTGRNRGVVKVSDSKTISTPIYDMNKIRVVKVESLVARKRGWTYSHSFQVHGHYRHYKNGKTIFIQPFIKGKGKEFKSQVINLEPTKA